MGRRTEICDIRREELTQAALKCIAVKGYDRVTLDDVTREAGLSKGIASYYFKNREELLASVIQKMWDSIVDLTRKILELPAEGEEQEIYEKVRAYYADPKVDPLALIRQGIRFLVEWIEENPTAVKVVLEFWCQVPRNPMITDLNRSMYRYLLDVSAIIIEEGVRKGVFRKRNPRLAAYILISGFTGLAYNHIINPSELDRKALQKDFSELVLAYLGK